MNRDIAIFKRREQGARVIDLAREYGLSKGRISAICKEQATLQQSGTDMPERLEAARLALARARAENAEAAATLAGIRNRLERGELLSRADVRESFSKVFASYRQATREVGRRYGADAARLLVDAERQALRG